MTAMERLISEITMRATATVLGPEAHPSRVERIAAPLAEAIVDLVVSQGNSKDKTEVTLDDFLAWEIWNRVLDEVEKEIPAVSRIEVILNTKATRTFRRAVILGDWKDLLKKEYPKKKI